MDLLEGEEGAAILNDVKKIIPRFPFSTIIIREKVVVDYKEQETRDALGL